MKGKMVPSTSPPSFHWLINVVEWTMVDRLLPPGPKGGARVESSSQESWPGLVSFFESVASLSWESFPLPFVSQPIWTHQHFPLAAEPCWGMWSWLLVCCVLNLLAPAGSCLSGPLQMFLIERINLSTTVLPPQARGGVGDFSFCSSQFTVR